MTVQLHYYGSVFDLDPRADDRHWSEFIQDMLDANHQAGRSGVLSVTLVGGAQANIPIFPGVPLVVVEPREDHPGESTFSGAVHWDDGSTDHWADEDI